MIFDKLASLQELDVFIQEVVVHFIEAIKTYTRPEKIRVFLDSSVAELVSYQSSLGRNIRNKFELWDNALLKKHNIHPDDFSYDCIVAIHKEANQTLRPLFFTK